ncbi:MAG: hypothetical protein CMJ83_12345, partial [Planctomycetes bacterium]|nr:hypothetical protein [Planctomycetota bacterium]
MTVRRLGNLELVREIGRGGMGTVWEARQIPSGKRVAVKCLHEGGSRSERSLTRFTREVRALERLRHPQIVPVLHAELDGETPHLVMPFVEGLSLWQIIRGLKEGDRKVGAFVTSALPECAEVGADEMAATRPEWSRAVARVGRDLAQALASAHAEGVIHRDLKPANVMIDSAGQVHLLDFGLVYDEQAARATLTLTEERLGTPLYMSPEQVARRGRVDLRADLYALGMTLYETLALEPPFSVDDLAGLYRAILEDDPPSVARCNPSVDGGLPAILSAALEKEPVDRYQDAGAFARDLGRWLRGDRPEPPRPSLWRRGRRTLWRRRRGIAVAALLLVVAAVGSWALGERHDGSVADRLARGHSAYRAGDLVAAADHFRAVLDDRPGDPDAVAGLRQVASGLARRAESHEESFHYVQAKRDLEVLQRLAPGDVDTEHLAQLESPSYLALGRLAFVLLDKTTTVVGRQRALEELGEERGELQVPAGERARLLVFVLGLQDIQPDVLADALRVAARFRVVPARTLAGRLLGDLKRPAHVRIAAAAFLAAVGVEEGRRALETMATMRDGPVVSPVRRLQALESLCRLNDAASAPVLIAILEEVDPTRARLAAGGLERIPVVRLDPDTRARLDAAIPARFAAASALADGDDLRAALIDAAGAVRGRDTTALLASVLQDPSWTSALRVAAATHLGKVTAPASRTVLMGVLQRDPDAEVRGAAALALRGRSEAVQEALLSAATGDSDVEVRARALVALGRGRVKVGLEPALEALRNSRDLRVRMGAILSVGLLRDPSPKAVHLLETLLRTGRPGPERLSAAWALGRLRDPSVLPALVSVLAEERDRIAARVRAEDALLKTGARLTMLLGRLGDFRAVLGRLPGLIGAADGSTGLAESVVLAIGELVPRAEKRLADDAVLALTSVATSARRARLRAAAVAALGRLPKWGEQTAPLLMALDRSETRREVRRALVLALVRLGR